jgi:hypothetical protein
VTLSIVLWTVWKSRNMFCFQENWKDVRVFAGRCARMLRDWRVLQRSEDAAVLEGWMKELDRRAVRPTELT